MLTAHSKHYKATAHDYSVTELLQPRKVVQLRKRYADMLGPQDKDKAFNSIASFLGTGIHGYAEKLLRRARSKIDPDEWKYILEKRFYVDVYERRISGQWDIYDQDSLTLYDIKTTSVWSAVYGIDEKIDTWTKQLNLYAYMANCGGPFMKKYPVHKASVIAMFLDWSKSGKSNSGPSYPEEKIVVYPIKVMSEYDQQALFCKTVLMHKGCESIIDDDLPDCTPEEMWEGKTVYAIMKKGQKRAVRLLDTEEDIETYCKANKINLNGKKYHVDIRKGDRIRCRDFCDVNVFCKQWEEYNNSSKGD